MRRFCLIRKYISSFSRKDTYIYFNDIDKPFDTIGMYGFDKYSEEVIRVPFTKNELVKALGLKVFYTKCEFNYNRSGDLTSIKCGDSFLGIKRKNKGSYYSEKEINKLLKDNF